MSDADQDLLRRFARDHAQDAFTEIVRRHVNLVFSAARRQVRSPQLAEEVAQSVFGDLARNAEKLCAAASPLILTAWLYQVTRHTAVDVVRRESRRQLREQIAVEMNAMNTTAAAWPDLEPFLDEAMQELEPDDRAAVLLRYFENQSFRDVGAQLGLSEDAAQKRVSRAVEKLRDCFSRRKIIVGAGGLIALVSANAVQSAPIGLAAAIAAAALAGTAVTASTVIVAAKTIAMTTLQKNLVTAAVAVLVGAGIYQAKQAHDARAEVKTLRQQQSPLADQIRQLQNNFADATNRLDNLLAENARLQSASNEAELLRLRGDIGMLRGQLADAKNGSGQIQQPPLATAREYLSRASLNDEKREYEAELDDLNHAIELDPTLAKAYLQRGNLYCFPLPEKLGGMKRAIVDYTRCLELKPNDGPARRRRASCYDLTGQYNEAIADLTTYIEADTDFSDEPGGKTRSTADAHLMRARVYQKKKDYLSAIADYTTAIQMYPKYENVYRMRGECYEAIGETAKAQQDFAIEPKR